MEIVKLHYPDQVSVDTEHSYSLAIGFFDGLHLGHQTVIREAQKKAKELGLRSAVMTFDPHPSHLFNSGKDKVGYITQYDEKVRLLEAMGIETLFIVHFDWDLASLSPEHFVELFIKGLDVKHVTAGFDFTFGARGAGTMEKMTELADGSFGTTVVSKVEDSRIHEKISSTRIRQLLELGKVHETAQLLGRPFRTIGTVVHGEKRGRKLGFPTANILPSENSVVPSNGVYAVRITVDGKILAGVCNKGVKPTFHNPAEPKAMVEVNIFDFDGDLYDKEVFVDWIERIRNERKFDSLKELVDQITKDKETAKKILSS